MRKRLISPPASPAAQESARWLDLESIAEVEVTSEDPAHPVEAALRPDLPGGWQASEPGPQLIRLFFDEPRRIGVIRLLFREENMRRQQEFLLRWADSTGGPFRDILRQGFHFSPPGTVEELESYQVNLAGVKGLELSIVPDISGTVAHASLAELRLA